MLGSGQSRSSDSHHTHHSNRPSGNNDSVKRESSDVASSSHHSKHHRHHSHHSERSSSNVNRSGSSHAVEFSDSDDGQTQKKRREHDGHKRTHSNKLRRDSIPLYRHHRERMKEHVSRAQREESDREDGERSRDTSPDTPINDTAPDGKKELLLRKLEQERSLRSSLERGINSSSPSLSPSHNILACHSRSPIQQQTLEVSALKPSSSNEKQPPLSSHSTTDTASPSLLKDKEQQKQNRSSHSRSLSPRRNRTPSSSPQEKSPPSPSPKSPTPARFSPKPAPSRSSSRSPSPSRHHDEKPSSPTSSRSSSRSQPRDSPPLKKSQVTPSPSPLLSKQRSRSRSPLPSLSPISPASGGSSPHQSVLDLTPPSPSLRKRRREHSSMKCEEVLERSVPPTGSDSVKDSPPLDHSPLINSPKVDRKSSPREEPPSPHLQLSESDDEENKVKVPVSDPERQTKSVEESDDDNDQILYHFPPLMGCRSVNCYRRKNKIDEGMYGVVFRAEDKITGEIVALKKIKMQDDHGGSLGGFPVTSLREINILRALDHPNIVSIKEIVTGDKAENIFMVMEYMEHDLKMLMRSLSAPFSQAEVKCLIKQLLEATACMHENWILHRDLKTSNLLLNNQGILKVCDFGMARVYGSPLGKYTGLVVTLWYRAPELLFGSPTYSSAVDMWSVGCIFAEFLLKEPLIAGKSELLQLTKMFKLLGTPTPKQWPGMQDLPLFKTFNLPKSGRSQLREKFPRASYHGGPYLSDLGFDLLQRMLAYDPAQRISASDALKHPYFKEFPLPQDPSMMRSFPSLNEDGVSRANRHRLKSGIDPHVIRDELEQQKAQNGFFLRDS